MPYKFHPLAAGETWPCDADHPVKSRATHRVVKRLPTARGTEGAAMAISSVHHYCTRCARQIALNFGLDFPEAGVAPEAEAAS